MPKMRINEKNAPKMTSDNEKGTRYFDDLLHGFFATAYPSGRLVFALRFRIKGEGPRLLWKIGTHPPMTVATARDKAEAGLNRADAGKDPRVEEKEEEVEAPKLFRDWAKSYLAEVTRRKKNPSPDRRFLGQAIKRWGERPIVEISVDDVRAFMEHVAKATAKRHAEKLAKLGEQAEKAESDSDKARARERLEKLKAVANPGHTQANRALASVRACLSDAWRAGWVVENVAMKVRQYRENPPRARVLTDDEMGRLVAAIEEEKDAFIRVAFLLLVETGARSSEVVRARWEDFDLAAAEWRIPSPKAGRPQVIPLAARTVGALRRVLAASANQAYVVPGQEPGTHRNSLRNPWDRIRLKAKLPSDVTLHDLRRSFGLQVARKAGLHVASKILRHSDIRVTERVYAPLGIDELRKAMEKSQRKVVKFPKAEGHAEKEEF